MCFIYFASTFLFNATIDAAVAVAEQQAYSLSITTKFYMLRHLVVNKCSNAYIHCVIFFFFFILWISISMQYTSWLLCHFDTYLNGLSKKKNRMLCIELMHSQWLSTLECHFPYFDCTGFILLLILSTKMFFQSKLNGCMEKILKWKSIFSVNLIKRRRAHMQRAIIIK